MVTNPNSADPVARVDADPGLFGPSSVTWRIHGDPAGMGLGGLRALLLQALHPLAMAGVAQHSGFRGDPWGRLQRTGEYVATVSYGTTAEAQRAARRVRGVHARLAGVEPESGRAYRVADPELLLWVHAAEVDSFLTAYRRCGGRLTPAQADTYVAEQVRAAALVGVEVGSCPDSVASLRAYFRRVRPELRATAEARRALRFVASPPMPLLARPAWVGLTGVAFSMLPSWARVLYGPVGWVTFHPGTHVGSRLAGGSLRRAVALLPGRVRESPARKAAFARLSVPA